MIKQTNGVTIRKQENGYIAEKGKRQIFFIVKSVAQGEEFKKMITEMSFNKLFQKGKKINLLGNNIRYITL